MSEEAVPEASGPCEWPVLTEGLGAAWDAADEEQQTLATAIAVQLLWGLSGRRFGVCTSTVRPVSAGLLQDCTAAGRGVFRLRGPVVAVLEVLVDGEALEEDAWQLHENELHRTGAVWPASNDLSLPDTEVGTWSIQYQHGIPVPLAGQFAAGVFAREILAGLVNAPCKLPARAQHISREGVDMTLVDPTALFDAGRTGIREVDMWLAVVNPHKRQTRPSVWSPDLPDAVTSGGYG